jgi:hypothetical protein
MLISLAEYASNLKLEARIKNEIEVENALFLGAGVGALPNIFYENDSPFSGRVKGT